MADLLNNTPGKLLNPSGPPVPPVPGSPGGAPNPWVQGAYGSYQSAPFNYSPGPDAPGVPLYQTGYDPSTMGTRNNLNMQLGDNLTGMGQFRQEAMRQGPSRWATAANQQQGLEELNAREKGARDVAGQTAQAESQMAMRGGITSGAKERMALEGDRNFLNMSQGISRQGSQNRLQIGVNDEQNRIEQLGMLPGLQAQQAGMLQGANQFDVGQQTQEMQNKNIFNSNAYNQQMKGWAAQKTGQGIANSGK